MLEGWSTGVVERRSIHEATNDKGIRLFAYQSCCMMCVRSNTAVSRFGFLKRQILWVYACRMTCALTRTTAVLMLGNLKRRRRPCMNTSCVLQRCCTLGLAISKDEGTAGTAYVWYAVVCISHVCVCNIAARV